MVEWVLNTLLSFMLYLYLQKLILNRFPTRRITGTKRLFSWLIYNSITQQYQLVSLSRVENQTNSNKHKQFLILKTEKKLKAITLPFCHMVQINMNT